MIRIARSNSLLNGWSHGVLFLVWGEKDKGKRWLGETFYFERQNNWDGGIV